MRHARQLQLVASGSGLLHVLAVSGLRNRSCPPKLHRDPAFTIAMDQNNRAHISYMDQRERTTIMLINSTSVHFIAFFLRAILLSSYMQNLVASVNSVVGSSKNF